MALPLFKYWSIRTPSKQYEPQLTQQAIKEKSTQRGASNTADGLPTPAEAKVVHLPDQSPLDFPAGLAAGKDLTALESVPVKAPAGGLLETPCLKAFFEEKHFALGMHNGVHQRTQDASEQGRHQLVARFLTVLAELESQFQAKFDRLSHLSLQTNGVCETTTARIQLECSRLERDMSTLQAQSVLAEQGKGWVLRAINEYQSGFAKGVRLAVDYELLN